MSAHDVVVDIIAEAFMKFINRLCECEHLRELHNRDLELAKIADEVSKALSEERGRFWTSDGKSPEEVIRP